MTEAINQDTLDIVWESLSDASNRNDGISTGTDTARYLIEALAERGMCVAPIAPADLAETLKGATPGPYGFQSYGRRERLVTMAAATQGGTGEPFAIFNRSEDARAFARAMTFALNKVQ